MAGAPTPRAAEAIRRFGIVDMTVCAGVDVPVWFPSEDAFEAFLDRYAAAGVTWASLTLAGDEVRTVAETMSRIANARAFFQARCEKYLLIETMDDVARARRDGRMAINFHFQGANPFAGDLKMVEVYRRLGVGHALLAYNLRNDLADGCHERTDAGLSRLGLQFVAEMNRVGMVVDVTHTGYRSSMDALEASTRPVIFSHSNAKAVFNHGRNIGEDQLKACARTGGVVGVNGVGLFLSQDRFDVSAERVFAHLDYIVQLIGGDHVGIGLDWVENLAALGSFVDSAGSLYPDENGYHEGRTPNFAGPEVFEPLVELMLVGGYPDSTIDGILAGNWLRAYSEACRPEPPILAAPTRY
jgi:membrane dipeptidase